MNAGDFKKRKRVLKNTGPQPIFLLRGAVRVLKLEKSKDAARSDHIQATMDRTGSSPPSSPELNRNTRHESRLILGRSEAQKGKKRKNGAVMNAGDFKKRKRVLKNTGKDILQLSRIIANQESLTDRLLHQLTLGSEGLELELLKDKLGFLCPDPSWDVWMSETKNPFGSNLGLKDRCMMVDMRVQLLYEIFFL